MGLATGSIILHPLGQGILCLWNAGHACHASCQYCLWCSRQRRCTKHLCQGRDYPGLVSSVQYCLRICPHPHRLPVAGDPSGAGMPHSADWSPLPQGARYPSMQSPPLSQHQPTTPQGQHSHSPLPLSARLPCPWAASCGSFHCCHHAQTLLFSCDTSRPHDVTAHTRQCNQHAWLS